MAWRWCNQKPNIATSSAQESQEQGSVPSDPCSSSRNTFPCCPHIPSASSFQSPQYSFVYPPRGAGGYCLITSGGRTGPHLGLPLAWTSHCLLFVSLRSRAQCQAPRCLIMSLLDESVYHMLREGILERNRMLASWFFCFFCF